MTADGMRVDTTELRSAEPAFDLLANGVDTLLARLWVALDIEGPCWGADEVGAKFAGQYLRPAQQARAGLTGLSEAMAAVGHALLAVADGVDAADGRARSRLG